MCWRCQVIHFKMNFKKFDRVWDGKRLSMETYNIQDPQQFLDLIKYVYIILKFKNIIKLYCHEVGWVCPITSLHLQHVTNLYISMFFIRYHYKIGLWNVLRDFLIAMEIPSKRQVRFNDFTSVTSYLWLNWMCRVLIGQSYYLIAWVWILAIAIAIGPLLIRPITKNYLCYRISAEVYFDW